MEHELIEWKQNVRSTIDAILPKIMLEAAQVILYLIGVISVIAYVNPVFLIPILFMAFNFVFIRRAFLKTTKSIKYLEANGKLTANKGLFQ